MFKNHNWWFLKWKYPKKELLWSQLLLIFLLLKYDVVHQWCINWKLRHISNRDIKLVVFPALHIFRSGQENHCFFFLFGLEIAQNRPWWGSWWVSVADRKYNECLLLKSDISYQSHLLLINSAILSVNFFMFTFKTIFLLFFMLFIKENILLMKNQRDLVLRYVLVILSRFEKTLQTTKSKLTNEKTKYNEL